MAHTVPERRKHDKRKKPCPRTGREIHRGIRDAQTNIFLQHISRHIIRTNNDIVGAIRKIQNDRALGFYEQLLLLPAYRRGQLQWDDGILVMADAGRLIGCLKFDNRSFADRALPRNNADREFGRRRRIDVDRKMADAAPDTGE